MTLQQLNIAPEAQLELSKCCGSTVWVAKMLEKRPFTNEQELFNLAEEIWRNNCTEQDWLEAFAHHPKIGDIKSLERKFASTKKWASGEQSGVNNADFKTLQELADLNQEYEYKFGYIFIVCATGKSAEEMLMILKSRINNSAEQEIKIAAEEQNKITKIRLEKLLNC